MMNKILYQNIQNSTAHRASRDFNSNYIFENPELLKDLMEIGLDIRDKNHYKACWVLELVFEKHIDWISPYLNDFCKTLPLYSHDGAVRSISKICLFATNHHLKKLESEEKFLEKQQLQQLIETCFDWLISDTKVASKAYAMRALLEFGKLEDWIYPEMKVILEQDYPNHSAGYQAACKDVLKKISRNSKT